MYSPDGMFSRDWWRTLAPYLTVSAVITLASAVAYSEGAPLWVLYSGATLAILAALPGQDRWEERHR
jgi:hypothetical protein